MSLKSDKNNGYFTWRPIYVYVKWRWILVRIRNSLGKNWRKNQNTHFVFSKLFFFPKFEPFMRQCWKTLYRRTGHRRQYGACVATVCTHAPKCDVIIQCPVFIQFIPCIIDNKFRTLNKQTNKQTAQNCSLHICIVISRWTFQYASIPKGRHHGIVPKQHHMKPQFSHLYTADMV